MRHSKLYVHFDKDNEEIVEPVKSINTQNLKIGNSTEPGDTVLHVQSRENATLFLEGDTDNGPEQDVPLLVGTTDGGITGFAIGADDTGATQEIYFDLLGNGAQVVDFTVANRTITSNGTGNLPTLGARTELFTINRNNGNTTIFQGGLILPNAGVPLAYYNSQAVTANISNSAGTWGGAASQAVTGFIERIGNTVTLRLNSAQHVLNLQGYLLSDAFIPVDYRPVSTPGGQSMVYHAIENAVNYVSLAVVTSAGAIGFYRGGANDQNANDFLAASNSGWANAMTLVWQV